MFCQMAFTGAAFERLIKYRIADAFRPINSTIPFPPGTNSWLDGVLVTGVEFAQIENDRFVARSAVGFADHSFHTTSSVILAVVSGLPPGHWE